MTTVLFLCWEYPPVGSGIGRYVAEMSSALREAGHRTVVLTSRSPGAPEEEYPDNGCVLRLFERSELRSSRVARLASDIARHHGADWIETADHWGEGARLLGLRNRPPVVVRMHYNDVLLSARYAQAWYSWQRVMIDLACVRQWRALRAERQCLERADVLTAPCRRIMDEALRQRLSLPAKRVVVSNPIRSMDTWENREAPAPTLLLVGRLDVGKGLPYLPALLEQLLPAFPDLRLEIAGGDSFARGLGQVGAWFRSRLGALERHVDFLGVLPPAALDEAYRRAWVVVVPSRWDTFPQAVLEAMVRGKAIVASPFGGMPEMLEDTQCPVADPGGPAFAEMTAGLLRSRERREAAGESARAVARIRFAPRRVAVEYVARCGSAP
jgi:glycosyltransferase involved in cell wall biosynthesis